MKESDLYEALLEIDEKMSVSLKNNNDNKSSRIEVIPIGEMQKETLKKIIKIVEKHGADITFGAIGVIMISFKEDEVVENSA